MDPIVRKTNIEKRSFIRSLWWVRTLLSAALFFAVGVGLIGALGLAQKIGWITSGSLGGQQAKGGGAVTYTCPMHPQIKQPTPGRCPICGMELVPATSATQDEDPNAVTIDPAARRVANIQTVKAQWAEMLRTIHTIGSIHYDESRLATIASYVDGRLERMYADYTGVKVAKGDHLAILYSPDLYSKQVEYLQSQETLKQMGQGTGAFVLESQRQLIKNARHQLVEYGMTEEQIRKLETTKVPQSRLTIYTKMGGTVINKKAAEGDYIKTGQPIYRIADLSTVWLLLELFPEDAAAIRHAQIVKAQVESLPGETFEGRVAFIDPVVQPKTRTVSVRVEMPNPEGKLKPGDYANATIYVPVGTKGRIYDADLASKWISPMHPQIIRDQPGKCPICKMDLIPATKFGYSDTPLPQPKGLILPREAILHVGKNNIVYVETEPGRFEIRPIVLGPVLNGHVVVLSGIEEGEQVATSGNFLIDSQMQLAGKPSLIDPTRVQKKGPLHLKHFKTQKFTGATGKDLEQLYSAYFAIQKTLTKDRKIDEQQAKSLLDPAKMLLAEKEFPQKLQPYLKTIQANAEHLHHLDLKGARSHFEKISEAVIKLAARARSKDAKKSFTHNYCPMVKSGHGNWLQDQGPLHNPYYGSGMLTCGNTIHRLPPQGSPQSYEEKEKAKKTEKVHKHHQH